MLRLIKPSHLIKNKTRSFWTITSSTLIGYIKSTAITGYLVPTQFIAFNETSTNLFPKHILVASVSHLQPHDLNIINRYILNETLVQIDFKMDIIGSPFNGFICYPIYACKITPFNDEFFVDNQKKTLDAFKKIIDDCNKSAINN